MFDGQSNSLSPDPGFLPLYGGQSYANVVMRHVDDPEALWFINAIGGTSYDQRRSWASAWTDIHVNKRPHSLLWSEGGPYELMTDLTSAQIVAEALAYNTERRSAGWDTIIGNTVLPAGVYTPTQETQRVAYNAAVRADPSIIGVDRVVDWAGIPQLTNPADTTYYQGDATHITAAGATLVGNLAYLAIA